jgi:MFS family permease
MNARKAPLFYGWWIVLATSYILLVGAGVGFYAQSVFLDMLVRTQHHSVTDISIGNTIFMGISGLIGILVGTLIERFDIRWILCAGAIMMTAALYALPHAETITEIYGFYALLGIAYSFIALIPCTTLITRWFERKRATALALAQSGLSLGGVLVTPILTQNLSLQGAIGAQAPLIVGLCLMVIPVCILFVRPYPADKGLLPDGRTSEDVTAQEPSTSSASVTLEFKDIVWSRFFILMTAASFFALLSQIGVMSHIFRWAAERADPDVTLKVIPIMAVASFSMRLICGYFLDRISVYKFSLALYAIQGISILFVSYSFGNIYVMLSTAIFGCSVGLILMVQPLLLANAFGLANFSRLLGVNQLIMSFGVALGPLIVGAAYDLLGGYSMSFPIVSGTSLLALVLLRLAGRPETAMQRATLKT